MFIQVIQGKCTRQDELRAMLDSRAADPDLPSNGFLGATYGFTDDDEFVAVVRFESQEAAAANSARPEQSAWAEQMMGLMDGPAEFHDCPDVTVMMGGGSDDAGFVQVIRGTVKDREKLKAMVTDTDLLHEARPEILGATLAIEDDGTFTQTIAFTDEESARRGEQQEMPADVREALESVFSDATYLDLHHPFFASAP